MTINTTYAYLAGLIDGEGCISIRRCKQGRNVYFKPMVEICMCEKEPIELIAKTFGGSGWFEIIPKGKNRKIIHKWRVTGSNTRPVLEKLLPYLTVKKEQAKLVFEICSYISKRGGAHWDSQKRAYQYEKRNYLFKKMFKLNHPEVATAL